MMAVELWETFKESITVYTRLSPSTFFTVIALGLALYYMLSNLFGSSDDGHDQLSSREFEAQMKPLPPPVHLGEITDEELKQYNGSDPEKPLLMAIKGQIYDITHGRMFYGPGGPYAMFAGKDASRALAKMSFEDEDLNGDLTGLGVFELEALQDWEYKFMGKYVKVGTVKTKGAGEPKEVSDADIAKTVEDGPSESVAVKETEETITADDTKKEE